MAEVLSEAGGEKNNLQEAGVYLANRLTQLDPPFSEEENEQLTAQLWQEVERVNAELNSEKQRLERGSEADQAMAAGAPTEMTLDQLLYFFQYAPRAAQKAGLENYTPVWIDPLSGTLPGEWDKEKWNAAMAVGDYLFPNLRKEIRSMVDEHGVEMREILDRGENLIFMCTHPSWYTLAFPIEILREIDPKKWSEHVVSLVLAPGPMMFRKKIGPVTFAPGPMLRASGTNVMITTPVNHSNEHDPNVKNMGDRSRKKFKIQFAREMTQMRSAGGRSLILAPEGSTTSLDEVTGEYRLKKISEGTAGMLERLASLGNTHFVLTGMREKLRHRRDTEPTEVSINLKILSSDALQKMAEDGNVAETAMHLLAETVHGKYGDSAQHTARITASATRSATRLD